MCCLTCIYFDPDEPEAHKKARLADPSNYHLKWGFYHVLRYATAHKEEDLQGVCWLGPDGKKKMAYAWCGQHKAALAPDNGWGVKTFVPQGHWANLEEFAREQYSTVRDESRHERPPMQQVYTLEEKNQELRRQLAIVRKRSADRLARLKKAKTIEPGRKRKAPQSPPPAPAAAAKP